VRAWRLGDAGLLTSGAVAVVVALAMAGCQGGPAALVLRTTGALHGVAAVSAGDAWAVGQAGAEGSGCLRPLIIHWNGRSWARVSSPEPGGGVLSGVAFTSARNGWAVGVTCQGKPLIVHWDGTAWRQVPAPRLPGPAELNGVAAVSASRAWAVGDVGGFARPRTLILRWDGAAWTRVPSPSPPGPGGAVLHGVAADSPGRAWAVGTAGGGRPLADVWNGRTWTQVATLPREGVLQAVTAMSPKAAWAVGYSSGHKTRTLILRFDGRRWTLVPSPDPARRGCIGDVLSGVAASSPNSAWAVGGHACDPKTLILRWDGSAWTHVPSPTPAGSNFLEAVAATPGGRAWAVGSAHGGTGTIFAERWNGTTWQWP
jgi:hypothetical protein